MIAQTDLPGHTVIGRAFLVGRLSGGEQILAEDVVFAFTGDTILMGGIGRTDFPCSSVEHMYESLRRLPKLISTQTIICPTHDYNNEFATTLEFERHDNEFLASILDEENPLSFQEFSKRKPAIDAAINDESNSELVCGLIKGDGESKTETIEIRKDELKQFFEVHRNSVIINVREPHEFSFAQDWSELGLAAPPENIPLTRLSGYLPNLLRSHRDPAQE